MSPISRLRCIDIGSLIEMEGSWYGEILCLSSKDLTSASFSFLCLETRTCLEISAETGFFLAKFIPHDDLVYWEVNLINFSIEFKLSLRNLLLKGFVYKIIDWGV